jgi:hypothetical protein
VLSAITGILSDREPSHLRRRVRAAEGATERSGQKEVRKAQDRG